MHTLGGVRALISIAAGTAIILTTLILRTLAYTRVPKCRPKHSPTHLLIVLGSGGHTAEMLSMLRRAQLDPRVYTYRTYVVSSGDNFSAAKAVEFEASLDSREDKNKNKAETQSLDESYTIVTVPRARRVHQSYLTATFSTLHCLWTCLLVLRGLHPDQSPLPPSFASAYPDVILTNGPATAVCVVLAAWFLRLWQYVISSVPFVSTHVVDGRGNRRVELVPAFQLRTIFVESWARVTTLSLSGKLLLPFVDRFLVQWPALEGVRVCWGLEKKAEYVGALVD